VIGIVPVVTTAANALYAQSLIQLDLDEISSYEPLKEDVLTSLYATDADGDKLSIDGVEMTNGGLLEDDLVKLINTDNYYKNYTTIDSLSVNILSVWEDLFDGDKKDDCETKFKLYTNPSDKEHYLSALEGYDVYGLNKAYEVSALIK